LHPVRSDSHERTPVHARFSQEIDLRIERSRGDYVCNSTLFPAGSQQGYGGMVLEVEEMIGGPWHQEVEVCVDRFTGELAGLMRIDELSVQPC
jgi:hypothetical protein